MEEKNKDFLHLPFSFESFPVLLLSPLILSFSFFPPLNLSFSHSLSFSLSAPGSRSHLPLSTNDPRHRLFLAIQKMSYEMTGQPTTYPYPPPGPAIIPRTPPRRQFSKWWPISFFIAAILFFIIGGGILGAWAANTSCVGSSYSSYSSRYSCSNTGMYYGGIACVAIGAICKFVAWVLLIVFCVKRSRHQPTSIAYTYQPLDYSYAGAPAYQSAAPAYQNTAPAYQNWTAPTPAAHPKESAAAGTRYCGHCGGAVTTPFCAQCGNRA